jgi:hypothetical protein
MSHSVAGGGMMEYKAWKFEADWYVKINNGLTLCMNQEAACIEFAAALARVEQLEDVLFGLPGRIKNGPVLKRVDAPPEEG